VERFVSSIWDFAQTTVDETGYATHDFFRWYGKLVPQLVRRLIEMYTKPGDRILANFAGSGTVLVEGDILGRVAVGLDSNPLAVRVCRAKLLRSNPDLSEFYVHIEQMKGDASFSPLSVPESEKWFSRTSLDTLQRIKAAIDRVGDPYARVFLGVALGAIVRHASRIDERSVNHIVVDFRKPEADVWKLFYDKLAEMREGLHEFNVLRPAGKADVLQGDARRLPFRDDSFRLVIAHPPYLGAIDFSNIHRLSLQILGLDYDAAQRYDMSSNRYRKYVAQVVAALEEATRVCQPGGILSVIIGDTRKDGFLQPTFVDVVSHMRQRGIGLRDVFIWVLSRKAGMNVARRGHHIDHNYILIFQKPEKRSKG